ncbi:hypothetical protein GCK32_018254 [Trichostrongylus colubriformis]|uniref:Uncharacterized protein n=1 Tax=Trichostrongylus colubriformis TaxID=6319 RepID=A0AAN8FRB7_TRICO
MTLFKTFCGHLCSAPLKTARAITDVFERTPQLLLPYGLVISASQNLSNIVLTLFHSVFLNTNSYSLPKAQLQKHFRSFHFISCAHIAFTLERCYRTF